MLGESHHLWQRMVQWLAKLPGGNAGEAEAVRREIAKHWAKARLYYYYYYYFAQGLLYQGLRHTADDRETARASYMLVRIHAFLEIWKAADLDLERAIRFGKPTGAQLKQWRDSQAELREKGERALGEGKSQRG